MEACALLPQCGGEPRATLLRAGREPVPDIALAGLRVRVRCRFPNPNPNPNPNPLHQVSPCSRSLWSDKYQLRAQLARDSGNPGNSCIHLTDRQTEAVLARRGASLPTGGGGGMSCDESYGFGGANPDPGRWP